MCLNPLHSNGFGVNSHGGKGRTGDFLACGDAGVYKSRQESVAPCAGGEGSDVLGGGGV